LHGSAALDPHTGITTAYASGVVAGVLTREVARRCDPIGWSAIAPAVFVETRRIEDPSEASRPATTGLSRPSDLGVSWTGLLYEHARLALFPGGSCEIKNVLHIQYSVDLPTVIRMEFRLVRCLWSRIGLIEQIAAVDEDSGFAELRQASHDEVAVTAVKRIRFLPPRLLRTRATMLLWNAVVPIALKAWLLTMVSNAVPSASW
jgi:hypothetical protein